MAGQIEACNELSGQTPDQIVEALGSTSYGPLRGTELTRLTYDLGGCNGSEQCGFPGDRLYLTIDFGPDGRETNTDLAGN
jgi:hypothetical protein